MGGQRYCPPTPVGRHFGVSDSRAAFAAPVPCYWRWMDQQNVGGRPAHLVLWSGASCTVSVVVGAAVEALRRLFVLWTCSLPPFELVVASSAVTPPRYCGLCFIRCRFCQLLPLSPLPLLRSRFIDPCPLYPLPLEQLQLCPAATICDAVRVVPLPNSGGRQGEHDDEP